MRLFKVRFVPTNSSMGDLSVMGRLTEAAPPSKYTASFWEGLLFDEMEVAVSEKAASAAFNKSLSRKYMWSSAPSCGSDLHGEWRIIMIYRAVMEHSTAIIWRVALQPTNMNPTTEVWRMMFFSQRTFQEKNKKPPSWTTRMSKPEWCQRLLKMAPTLLPPFFNSLGQFGIGVWHEPFTSTKSFFRRIMQHPQEPPCVALHPWKLTCPQIWGLF